MIVVNERKTMKRRYKEAVRLMGVYQVKNMVNGKVFIGSAKNLQGKLNGTRFQLEMGSHMNRELQQEWNSYGEQNFLIEILEALEPVDSPAHDYSDDLQVLEELWLEKLQPYGEKGYNKKKRRSCIG